MPRYAIRSDWGLYLSPSFGTSKQKIRKYKQHPVRDMQSFCQVNFLKTLLALFLIGFLLHPGRFAVLQYQLLHPLPMWPRCFVKLFVDLAISSLVWCRADPAMSSYIHDKGQQSTQVHFSNLQCILHIAMSCL